MKRTLRGTAIGLLTGTAIGIVGELVLVAIREFFPTDVAYVGFVLIWAAPLGALVGAICGWRDWFFDARRLATVAAAPGFVAGVLAVIIQLAAV